MQHFQVWNKIEREYVIWSAHMDAGDAMDPAHERHITGGY